MVIVVKNHPYQYDMENLGEIFFPYEKIVVCESADKRDPITVITSIDGNLLSVDASVYDKRKVMSLEADYNTDRQNALSVLYYKVLSEITGIKYPWGILYGVRPVRLVHRLTDKYGESKAKRIFKEKYLINEAKASLAFSVMHRENKIISLSKINSFSLYVSIPFCPTRCSYCSFVSHSIENTQKLIEPYVDLLIKELEETGRYAKSLGLNLESIYFGGGTPTSLSAEQLSRIFKAIEAYFDLSAVREYTVEAGRPDTVSKEKLLSLKSAQVGRISINPQSFNDDVLKIIGRHHTSYQTVQAFNLARSLGFENINMDFIAGLPKDTLESFKSSVSKAVELGAESITIHTLALKSGAYMATRNAAFDLTDKLLAANMVECGSRILRDNNYFPYYMYRQGKSLGNLENVGWCKEGFDCLYNVFMMDETHTVLAVGAGAVIKLKNSLTGRIERIYNYKYPYEYISGFDEILNRKKRIKTFYNEYYL